MSCFRKSTCKKFFIVECVSEYIFLIQKTNIQAKKTRIQKNQKKLKKKKEYLRKIDLKKLICVRPGEYFSRHRHFRKQRIFVFCFGFSITTIRVM